MNLSGYRYILCSVILLSVTGQAFPQSFAVILGDTMKSGIVGSEIIFDARIKNQSGGALTLAFVRISNPLPAGWQSAMCLGTLCFAPNLDSIALTQDFGFSPLLIGDSIAFSVHVTPQPNPGSGTVVVVAKNLGSRGDTVIMRFITNATANAVLDEPVEPVENHLLQNYPNPFNPTTRIGYSVGVVSGQSSVASSQVRLAVYDLLGREVAVLVDEAKGPGTYWATWNASSVSTGMYLCRLTVGIFVESRTMVVME
jgi:hypothetical protein